MKNQYLQEIKGRAKKSIREGHRNLLVFDLDSTLYDVSPRTQKILVDFANEPHNKSQFPQETELMKAINVNPSDWGVRTSVERLPFISPPPNEFLLGIKNYWMERFFDNSYLHHDTPYSGAVDFVKHFASNPGNDIVYLTGRDMRRMLLGTEKSLAQHGFPLPGKNVRLAMKPNGDISDTEFKFQWFSKIESLNYAHIWFFENEPTNIERVASEHSTVEIVFFDSTHSGKLASPTHFPTISDYL